MAALIAAGRSELDPEARQTTYEEAAADRLRRGLLRVARQQRGHLRPVREPAVDAAGRRQAARRRDERRRVTRDARPMGACMTERSGDTHRSRRERSSGEVHAAHGSLQGAIVIVGVTVLVFVVTRMVGDPVNFILPLSASQEQRDELRASLGFDRSIFTPVRVVRRRRHPSRLRRVHLLPQRGGARHRHALPPQDAAARRRRDEHRLLRVASRSGRSPPSVRDACSTRRSSRSASSAWRRRSSSSAR